MISRISGRLISQNDHSLLIDVQGLSYEVWVPAPVLQRVQDRKDEQGRITLVTYHYLQMAPSSAVPVIVGFLNEIERDFFLQFIKVSGIGPRAAVKALNKPISEISRAIDRGDGDYLKTLPGIGAQKAKEIVAKLQGKIGKYGLIRDRPSGEKTAAAPPADGWREEAMEVLLQLQYSKQEAREMIRRALERAPQVDTAEDLLNEIYKQRTHAS